MEPSALSTEDWKSIASWLLHGNVDEGVSQVLGLLGSRHGSDRAWVIRYDDDFTHLWNTHEWTAPGVASFVAELQGIPVEAGTWVHEGMQRDGRVLVADVARMPRRARGLQMEFQRQGILSLLALPVYRNDRLAFQIGYDSVRCQRIWSETEIRELADAAELIARCLENRAGHGRVPFPAFAVESRLIHLRIGAGSVAVPLSEIHWVEADGDYTVVHTRGNRRITERAGVGRTAAEGRLHPRPPRGDRAGRRDREAGAGRRAMAARAGGWPRTRRRPRLPSGGADASGILTGAGTRAPGSTARTVKASLRPDDFGRAGMG